jgi:hypothetical protein
MQELFEMLTPQQKADLAKVSALMKKEPEHFRHGQGEPLDTAG